MYRSPFFRYCLSMNWTVSSRLFPNVKRTWSACACAPSSLVPLCMMRPSSFRMFYSRSNGCKTKIGLSNGLQMSLLRRWEKLRAGWDAKKKGSGICANGHTENRLLDITRENAVQGNRIPNPAPRSGHWKGWLYNSTYHTATVSLYIRLPLVTSCIGCCTTILTETSIFPVLLFSRCPWKYNVWNAW